jgi:uncharacterized membrane protein YccC
MVVSILCVVRDDDVMAYSDRRKRMISVSTYAWQTARLLAACALCYGIADFLGLKEEYWALITVVVVTQPEFGSTVAASRNRVIGTLVGAAAGFIVLEAAQRGMSSFALFWVALVPLAGLTAVWPNLRLSCVTLVVVVLIPSDGPPFERPLERVFGILIGTVVSVVVAAVLREPQQKR